jgi:hypothetical protein
MVLSPPARLCQIALKADDPAALARTWEVRWEREYEGKVVTAVWNNDAPYAPIPLEHVPNFGVFHRLVVETRFLELVEGAVLRVGDLLVRFVIGEIEGERAEPVETVQYASDRISIESGWIGTSREQGRFIEIIAPGASSDEAESSAHSTLGLIAALMGPHAVGPVRFSERHENVRATGGGTTVTTTVGRNPWFVGENIIDMVERALPALRGDGRMANALTLALRWYEHGNRGETVLDEFLSYFVGIEAIVTAHATEHGPLPEVEKRQAYYEGVEQDLARVVGGDKGLLKRLRDKLVEPALADRFSFYVGNRGWETKLIDQFAALAAKRNRVFHGSSVIVDAEDARRAKRLLARLARRELDLPETMDWESLPLVFPLRIEGRTMTGTGDLRGTVFEPDPD